MSLLTLGFSQAVMNHPFRLGQVESMKAAARLAGARLLVTDANGSTELEIANIDWLLDRGVDAIIVSSLSGSKIYPAYWKVSSGGIPLILSSSGIPSDDTPYTAFVGPDEVEMGARAAAYIGERLHGAGRIVVLRGIPESSNSRLRSSGFEREIASRYPQVEVLAREPASWLRKPSQYVMAKLLAKLQDIDAVFAENDEMALGAVDALRSWHRQSEAFVVGLDGQREALREIWQRGPFKMTIKSDWDGAKAVQLAIAAAAGEEVPRRVNLDAPLIDRNNVGAFLSGDGSNYAEPSVLEGVGGGHLGASAAK